MSSYAFVIVCPPGIPLQLPCVGLSQGRLLDASETITLKYLGI